MTGLHFWSAGYCVSTVGLDEVRVRQYIREQDELDRRQGELSGPSGALLTSGPPTGATSRERPQGGHAPNGG
jgi:hypothetical protein